MIATLHLILLVAAFVLFVLSAIGVPSPPRFNLLAAGLACWVFTLLLVRASG
jgi:hypothetical protein